MSGIFFTSDQHFGHANVIPYCNRPFRDLDHMRETLIEKYNSIVSDEDDVFHLGDFSLHPRELLVLPQLKGRKHLIAGNHDKPHPASSKSPEKQKRFTQFYLDSGFTSVTLDDRILVTDDPTGYPTQNVPRTYELIIMSHLPYYGDHTGEDRFKEFRPEDKGHWLLHGHVHQAWRTRARMINVGVDRWNYKPVSMEDIRKIIRAKNETLSNRE